MDHKTLYVRNVSKKGEDLQVVDELPRFILAALDLKCEDGGAAVGEVLLIKSVIGNILDLRMSSEIFHYLLRVLSMSVQSQGQSLHTLQKQECVEGGDTCAGIAEQDRSDICDECSWADCVIERDAVIAGVGIRDVGILAARLPVELAGLYDDAAECRAVTAYELGRGVYNDVRAVLDGADQIRGSECIVDDQRKAVLVGNFRDRVNVRDIAVGISKSLKINRSCVVLDRAFDFFQVVGVNKSPEEVYGTAG